jgi:hypothetical protein
MTKSEYCGVLSPKHGDLTNVECTKVERVAPNALHAAALPPDSCGFGDHTGLVFRAVTEAKQRPGFPADPP